MDRRNTLYYGAAAGTVLVFIIALIGLTTCGNAGSPSVTPQEQAVLNAYQQGYLDGYSKGYSDGFSAGMASRVANPISATVPTSRGCALPATTAETVDSENEAAEYLDQSSAGLVSVR
jgi:hypothetical protein